ncbi:hypothetical protein LWI29_000594 [Acer saccharum]|uniref:Uncharacterized protein n=1 Tax=Acer saccharum TaxID=4024 RepID=A0AA39SAP7_ACESA|nr:hypothetical protein LWI29_000594 [Acer saccharum]
MADGGYEFQSMETAAGRGCVVDRQEEETNDSGTQIPHDSSKSSAFNLVLVDDEAHIEILHITPKKRKCGKRCPTTKSHGMKTRNSKVNVLSLEKENCRHWNLEFEITKVIEKGIALSVNFNKSKGDEILTNSGEEWNLDVEVAKIIETGVSLGFNFHGKENEMSMVIASRELEDKARCRAEESQ